MQNVLQVETVQNLTMYQTRPSLSVLEQIFKLRQTNKKSDNERKCKSATSRNPKSLAVVFTVIESQFSFFGKLVEKLKNVIFSAYHVLQTAEGLFYLIQQI